MAPLIGRGRGDYQWVTYQLLSENTDFERPENERGAVLVMVAILILILLVCGTLAVDVSALERRGQTLQNTADAAALAATATWVRTGDPTLATAVARDLITQNGLDQPDISFGVNFPDPWTVEVDLADSSPDVFLGGIVGMDETLTRDAQAELLLCDRDCGIDVELSPPFVATPTVGDGDGYRPISVGDRFYAINHHGTNVVCIDRTTRQQCFSDRSAFRNGTDAITDQIVHTATVGTRIWWTAQEPTRLALYCWQTVTNVPCNSVHTVNASLRADHLQDNYRVRGGGLVEHQGRLYTFTDDHQVHCFMPDIEAGCPGYPQTTDLRGSALPWNPAYGQTGAGIDRIIEEGTGRIYYSMRARNSGDGVQAGTWLDCWNANTESKCSNFTPNMIHASGERQAGRPFFYRSTTGAIQGVCSTGISEIVCTDMQGNDAPGLRNALFDLEQQLPPVVDYHNAQGTHMYHPPTNRLFMTNPRWISTVSCWDFTTASTCGTLYGLQNGVETSDYGFIYEGDCMFALGHTSIFWAFTSDLEVGCPGSTAVERIDRCSCRDEELWGIIDFNFVRDDFDVFDVQILDPAGNVVVPADGVGVISLADGLSSIDLDESQLDYEYLQVSVYAETDGNSPWSVTNPPSFSISFEGTPVLVE